jgi:DNA-binding transcriptional regulator YdaS (Cro superfamily)
MTPEELRSRISPTILARAIGIEAPSLYKWTRIPAERCKTISAETGIPLWELRPDLWENPDV